MEDMAESRRILETHDWDLLNAISSHMGFEQIPERVSYSQSQQLSSSITPAQSSGVQNESVAVQRRRSYGPLNGRDDSNNNLGFFGWIWRLVSIPIDLILRYMWDFIGFGLRFLQQDPRRGKFRSTP